MSARKRCTQSRRPAGIRRSLALAVSLLVGGITAAHAQSSGTTTADLLVDARARVGDSQRASDELHGGYFTLHSDSLLGPDRFVDLEGIYQYKTLRTQRASIGTDLRLHRRGSVEGVEEAAAPLRLEAGIIRVPFGIYDYGETYSSGLISYPLPRLDYAYDSVDWGVSGFKATAINGPLQVETALFGGAAEGVWGNYNQVDGTAVRAQTYLPPNVVVGASVWSGHQASSPGLPGSRVTMGGVDMRYTRSHLLLRGEALAGTLAGDTTRGGYLDAYYRLPGVESVTFVGRVEALKPANNQPTAQQFTLGARWVVTPVWTFSGNYQLNNIANAYAFTWTQPTRRSGAILFQLLRRIPLH